MVEINDIRTIDGSNNQIGDELGSDTAGLTGAPLERLFDPDFADDFNEPRGGGLGDEESSLPNPRTISNALSNQPNSDSDNPLDASDWLWQWGQFLDHDLGLSEGTNILTLREEDRADLRFNIPIPVTNPPDILRGPRFTEIPLNRIEAVEGTGVDGEVREVENEVTAFIDGSNGYGSGIVRAAAKRTDLGNSFFGEAASDGEILTEEAEDGQILRFVEIEVEEESNVELAGTEEGSEGEEEGEAPRLYFPPVGESPYDGKLLVANDPYGTDGLAFEEGFDPNNTSGEILAPYNRADSPNADPDPDPEGEGRVPNDQEFISGDVRINEQSGLIAIHTLFIREHNQVADKVAFHLDAQDDEALNEAFEAYTENVLEIYPDATPEQIRGEFIYEAARAVVGAKNQVITYEEFLPILVGNESADDLEVINEDLLSPGIAAEFSGAAYRLGHTLLSNQIRTIDRQGMDEISLREAFFNPQSISADGLDNILVGLNYQESNDADTQVIDGLRNSLFGPPGSGGLDLVAINIQRGRELGIPGYTAVYNELNPDAPIENFDDLGEVIGADLAEDFAEVYDNVEDIDLWIGGLAEMPIEGALLGPTIGAIVSDQFARLRDYDRFFYEDQLADEDSFLSVVSNAIDLDLSDVTLASVIRANIDTPELVPDDAFRVPFDNERSGTVNGDRGDRRLVGSADNDLIDGLAGNDDIRGSQGDDILFGGAGNDTLRGQAGEDTLVGGVGNDSLEGQAGDVFIGGTGNDTYNILVGEPAGTFVVDETGNNDQIILSTDRDGGTLDLTLSDFRPGVAGIKKAGNDLLIDINQNGIIDPDTDLTVADYFNNVGNARASTIEQVSNLSSEEIIEYFDSPETADNAPVSRFFNREEEFYRYTISESEKDSLLLDDDYNFNGDRFVSAPQDDALDDLTGARPVYSFANENTSADFLTISEFERDVVLRDSTSLEFEGVAFYAYETQVEGSQPVYRFLNTDNGTHFYTSSVTERDRFLEDDDFRAEGLPGTDGVAFYVPDVDV
ncbi:MAG: peroxidase family protein [Cyanobacteria bacterium J06623_7]